MATEIRDLRDLEDLKEVIEIEKRVWGYADGEEAVPLPILAAAVRRGAIVLGAFDDDRMVGATYSFPAVKRGRLIQWSHMLGLIDPWRDRGVGRQLKVRQRERALEMGIDLIEWTFDPLQAANAHFNLVGLGAVVEDYERSPPPATRARSTASLPSAVIANPKLCPPQGPSRRPSPMPEGAAIVARRRGPGNSKLIDGVTFS